LRREREKERGARGFTVKRVGAPPLSPVWCARQHTIPRGGEPLLYWPTEPGYSTHGRSGARARARAAMATEKKCAPSSIVRPNTSPPVSPVARHADGKGDESAEKFTTSVQRADACAAAALAPAPTPASVVWLRQHFSKQRLAHERTTRVEADATRLDPLEFTKLPVGAWRSVPRPPPLSPLGCLAAMRGRALHFVVRVDESLQAAQRRLALAMLVQPHLGKSGRNLLSLDEDCLGLVAAAISAPRRPDAHADTTQNHRDAGAVRGRPADDLAHADALPPGGFRRAGAIPPLP
jgi:hypothetical protein